MKVSKKWLITGEDVTKEEVERAIIEQKEEIKMNQGSLHTLNGQASHKGAEAKELNSQD